MPAAKVSYGLDVAWAPREAAAFKVYNRLCAEQARAAFQARLRGEAPVILPAPALAAEARRQAAGIA